MILHRRVTSVTNLKLKDILIKYSKVEEIGDFSCDILQKLLKCQQLEACAHPKALADTNWHKIAKSCKQYAKYLIAYFKNYTATTLVPPPTTLHLYFHTSK